MVWRFFLILTQFSLCLRSAAFLYHLNVSTVRLGFVSINGDVLGFLVFLRFLVGGTKPWELCMLNCISLVPLHDKAQVWPISSHWKVLVSRVANFCLSGCVWDWEPGYMFAMGQSVQNLFFFCVWIFYVVIMCLCFVEPVKEAFQGKKCVGEKKPSSASFLNTLVCCTSSCQREITQQLCYAVLSCQIFALAR